MLGECEMRNMVQVKINHTEESFRLGLTITELLEIKKIGIRSSVWLNGKHLLRKEYSETVIQNGDVLKIIRIVGGG